MIFVFPTGQSLHIVPPTVALLTPTQSPDHVLVPIHALYHDLAPDHGPAHVPDHVLAPTPHTPEEAEVVAGVIVLDLAHLHTIVPELALLPIEGEKAEE